MHLNLPILEPLSACRNVLVAGAGGGFDVFCGLPLYFELASRGQTVHLANLSFADLSGLQNANCLTATLAGVSADTASYSLYFPELHLARWFREQRQEQVTVWCFAKTGARPLSADYRALVAHLGIDGILLIDGGVDTLLRGDEQQLGTPVEDACSLWAVNALENVPVRVLASVGLGAEQDVAYAQVFENIARLAGEGAFLGSCALTAPMEAYQAYAAAVAYVHAQPYQDPSVINASILSAVEGHYGNFHLTEKTRGSRLYISPLMALYWFFDLAAVARHNQFMPYLATTDTFHDALRQLLALRSRPMNRPPADPPLP